MRLANISTNDVSAREVLAALDDAGIGNCAFNDFLVLQRVANLIHLLQNYALLLKKVQQTIYLMDKDYNNQA